MTWSSAILQLTSIRVSAKKIAVKHSFTMATTLHFRRPHSCFVLIGHFNSNHLCILSQTLSLSLPPSLLSYRFRWCSSPSSPTASTTSSSTTLTLRYFASTLDSVLLCSGAVLNPVCVVKLLFLAYLYNIISLVT